MLREKHLEQDTELKTQRQRFGRSRKIQRQLKMPVWQPEIPKTCFMRWWLLLRIQVSAGDESRMAGTEVSCMAGAEVSHLAGDSDVLYGQRWLLTLIRTDGIQLYLHLHIYWPCGPLRYYNQASSNSDFQQLQSETVWVILQVPTMGRMGNMRMIKRQTRASRAKMMNPAGWRAQSPKQYSRTWGGFSRSRWILTNWHNQECWPLLTTSVKEIRCTAHANWEFC